MHRFAPSLSNVHATGLVAPYTAHGAALRAVALLLAIGALIPACAKQTTPSAFEALSVKASIDSLWTAYAHASDRKDADAFGAFFTEDAVLVHTGAATVRGREAIQTFLASRYADIDPTGLKVDAEETKVSGPIAVQSGTFEENFLEKGAERTRYCRYVLLTEQGDDRAWKIRRLAAITDSTK